MITHNIYKQLKMHLSLMGMMCSPREDLLIILKSNFSEEEVKNKTETI